MKRTAFILREILSLGKSIALVFLLLIGMQHCLHAQASQNQTTLYEWNVTNTASLPGERIVATISSGTIGPYTGAAIVGQIISKTAPYALAVGANAIAEGITVKHQNIHLIEKDKKITKLSSQL